MNTKKKKKNYVNTEDRTMAQLILSLHGESEDFNGSVTFPCGTFFIGHATCNYAF